MPKLLRIYLPCIHIAEYHSYILYYILLFLSWKAINSNPLAILLEKLVCTCGEIVCIIELYINDILGRSLGYSFSKPHFLKKLQFFIKSEDVCTACFACCFLFVCLSCFLLCVLWISHGLS